ncbi:MAG: ABC transporter ATP-binding protein [Chloroflexales bacterium]|nr:ABC transporter ATP-binding protein [Chloroflexales bacterium]
MSYVQLQNLTKRYGPTVAVNAVSLDVAEGEFVALLGPSGCGKTTTLRLIAGFIEPIDGRISFDNRDVTYVPPYRRDTGMVFQSYALFPHMTVADNIAFGLKMRKLSAAAIEERIAWALKTVQLTGLAERMPRQLSGGQQQRVALARALVINPKVLLLDEPLSNLDAKLRQEVRIEIRQIQQQLKLTTILVTHDQEEALTMADRLVVLNHGVVQQIGTPRELYEQPRNRFVAEFIGRSNFFAGALIGADTFRTHSGLHVRLNGSAHTTSTLAIRPEKLLLRAPGPSNEPNSFSGQVEFVTYKGAVTEYIVRLESGDTLMIDSQNESRGATDGYSIGQPVMVAWSPENCLLLEDTNMTENQASSVAVINTDGVKQPTPTKRKSWLRGGWR